jgi:hypothetical protein
MINNIKLSLLPLQKVLNDIGLYLFKKATILVLKVYAVTLHCNALDPNPIILRYLLSFCVLIRFATTNKQSPLR